ncbi:DNA topoisomerase-1 [Hasllibacter halocynthiae]|uniref:DNA topoisomerase n=1 Tax=Hasllibacter halocynthiae TaxID=595589 RepID=A0A2T0X1U1_9RHOB|nr:DNA topoisomerase IB [Hasllibacter halocynthiae]PRY92908.1 DNA topoisomerase-1 [Hasllibacter halocynthiae]
MPPEASKAEARSAGLVWYPDDRPGIARRRRGRGWSYTAPDGTSIDAADERARLDALAVPPAYTDVWISPKPRGHLQATGRDARTRKQYRYHPDWTEARAATKFHALPEFGRALPDVRAAAAQGLAAKPGSHEFALATLIRMIDATAIRVGSPKALEENGTYGATTLRPGQARSEGGAIELSWTAKGGTRVRKRLADRALARALHASADLPGRTLISWIDEEGEARSVRSEEVNDWLRETAGEGHTVKTFRTWHGTLAAFRAALDGATTIRGMTEAAAERLHNTPAIARKSYVHPSVIAMSQDGSEALEGLRGGPRALTREERLLIRFLEETDD